MTQEHQNELNFIMQKKQKFVHTALSALQKGDFNRAAVLFNIEVGLTHDIQNLISRMMPEDIKEPETVDNTDETLYEDSREGTEEHF